MKLSSLLLGTLVVFSTHAIASDWKKVATIGSDEYSLDEESLRLVSDAPTTIEVILAQKVGKDSGKKYKAGDTIFSVMRYNCDGQTYQTGISKHYDAAKSLKSEITEANKVYTYNLVQDNNVQKNLLTYVCKNADRLLESYTPAEDTGVYND